MATNKTVLTFTRSKVTKGALAFEELNADGNTYEGSFAERDAAGMKIGGLYLRKSGFAGEPQRIRVTIEVL